jgi:hypothetical protein
LHYTPATRTYVFSLRNKLIQTFVAFKFNVMLQYQWYAISYGLASRLLKMELEWDATISVLASSAEQTS